MSDLIIACIIAGAFFAFMIGIFVEGIIREWIAEYRDRKFYVGKPMPKGVWVFAEPEE